MNNTSNQKSTTLFALLALLVSASGFKDELKKIELGALPGTLFNAFIAAILLFSAVLALYLIIELKQGTFLNDKFINQDAKLRKLADHILYLSILMIVLMAIVSVVLNLYTIPFFNDIFEYFLTFGLPLLIVYFIAKRDINHFFELRKLPRDERKLVKQIETLSFNQQMWMLTETPEVASLIEKERKALSQKLEKIRTKRTKD